MDRELLKKLSSESGLTLSETLELERALESGSGDGPAAWMRALPQDEPSLAWRSGLNERLQAVSLAEASGGGSERGILAGLFSVLVSAVGTRWKLTTGLVAVSAAVAVSLFVLQSLDVERGGLPSAGGVVATPGVGGLDEDRVVGGEDSDLGVVLLTSHQADEAQLSMGVHAPRRTVESGFDWSRW